MRRILIACCSVLVLGAVLTGCSKKSDETLATETTSDSLLSTNPVEQPQDNLTPQEQYQEPTPPPAPEHPASKPKSTGTSHPRSGGSSTPTTTPAPEPAGVTLAAGTPIQVAVSTQVSTENAQVGDTWTGEVKDNVIVGNTVVIPAGSTVTGVVNSVTPAKKGDRASLGLAVRSVSANGSTINVDATTEPIVAGSTRARNVGVVAGSAAAGALIGKAAGGGKGALIGGLIGAAAGGAGVASSKGYQVKLKEGAVLTFTVDQPVLVKS